MTRPVGPPAPACFERAAPATARDWQVKAEVFLREGGQGYDTMEKALIADALAPNGRHIAYPQAAGRVGV